MRKAPACTGASSWAACVAPGVFRKHGDSLSGVRAAGKAPWRLREVSAPTVSATGGDGRACGIVRSALDRRHSPALAGTSAGRSGQWTWTRHGGGGHAGGNQEKEEQRYACAVKGGVSKSPGGERGSGGAGGPFFVCQKQKFPFLFGERQNVGEWKRECSTGG